MDNAANAKLPLQFILPAFPFKDQNPFRTVSSPDHVDLGEIALLIRLHVIALALYQIYHFGVEWVIVSDGVVYAPIFDVPEYQARAYQERLRDYRHRLNLYNTVHIIDMAEMTKRIIGFNDTYETILKQLQGLAASNIIEERLDILARGMKWNINTRQYLDKYDWKDLWSVVSIEQRLMEPQPLVELQSILRQKSRDVALRYAAFNLAMSHLGVMNCFFPHAIRATVHPKPGQVAMPCLGKVYPWNGTGVLKEGKLEPSSVESRRLYELLREGNNKPVYLLGDEWPFFYES